MTYLFALLATLCGCASAWLFYIASPQQQWRGAGAWPTRHRLLPGAALAALSLLAMWQLLAPLEAVFAWSILLMMVWTVAPFLGAWRARSRVSRSAAEQGR